MTESINFEPYLSDYAVCFHQIFTLIDPTLNTSEIKPLHLTIPHIRSISRVIHSKSEVPSTTPPSPIPNEVTQTISKSVPQHLTDQTVIDNKILTHSLFRTIDFWLYPVNPASQVTFIFQIDSTSSALIFRLFSYPEDALLLTAKMNGPTKSEGFQLSAKDLQIGEGRLDKAGNALYCGVTTGVDRGEAGCWCYNSGDFLIPAIKKVKGKARMYLIPMISSSDLLLRAERNAKEVLQMKSRDPAGDLSFGKTFEEKALANRQLFHESNKKKTLCAFGLRNDGSYILEISYPLSLIQGFIVGVAAMIP
jgi:hypothetical protein